MYILLIIDFQQQRNNSISLDTGTSNYDDEDDEYDDDEDYITDGRNHNNMETIGTTYFSDSTYSKKTFC